MPHAARLSLIAGCTAFLVLSNAAQAQSPAASPPAAAPAAPAQKDLSPKELEEIVGGWNVTDDLIDAEVVSDQNAVIGVIDNVYVVPKSGIAYAIIDASNLIGRPGHLVAVPVSRLIARDERYRWPGVGKEAIAAMPLVVYPE